MQLIPVVLCGGEGSRLWPVSRELHPKSFIRPEGGKSLLQEAFLRGAMLPGVEEVLTVTNRELFFKVEDEYREVNNGSVSRSFILEPYKRNTAAAIAAAAIQVVKAYGEEALILVLGANDLIGDQDIFQQAISDALELALQNHIVVFGVEPSKANTQYSWIEHKNDRVLNFIESSSVDQIEYFSDDNGYLWNPGIFLFKAGIILQTIEKSHPNILESLKKCIDQSRFISGDNFSSLDLAPESFNNVPEIAFAEIVVRAMTHIAVIPGDINWTSVGSWNALSELMPADANGNQINGEILLLDVNNCHIQSDSRLVGAVGIENLIVIDTPDALLVANKTKAHDIEHIYTRLKLQNHETHKYHRTVFRPWGSYTVLEVSGGYKIKRIIVKPAASLSLQMHHHRSEHWIVVSGMARVTNGEETFFIKTNESTYIPAGHKHRLENPGILDLVIIEVQSGEYLGEDDIVRFCDNYGRV